MEGESVFKIWVYFSLSYSALIGDKLNFLFFFPQVQSVLSLMVIDE